MKTLLLVLIAMSSTFPAFGAATLSYEDFVKSCQNPGNYGQQRPPESIRVACKDLQRTWEPVEAGSTNVSESRNISAELFSDKYNVSQVDFIVVVPDLIVSCPRFREVVQTTQIEKSLTCVQVVADTRALKDVCLDAINEVLAANPDLAVTIPTGRTFSTCSSLAQK